MDLAGILILLWNDVEYIYIYIYIPIAEKFEFEDPDAYSVSVKFFFHATEQSKKFNFVSFVSIFSSTICVSKLCD